MLCHVKRKYNVGDLTFYLKMKLKMISKRNKNGNVSV